MGPAADLDTVRTEVWSLNPRPVTIVTELPRLNETCRTENSLSQQYATMLGLMVVESNVLKLFTHTVF